MNRRPWKEKDIRIITKCVVRTIMYSNRIPFYTFTKKLQLMTNEQTSYCFYCSFKTKFIKREFLFLFLRIINLLVE